MSTQQQMQIQNWLDQAKSLLAGGLTQQARPLVRQAISLMPQHPEARRILASIELAVDQPARALAALDMQDLYHPQLRDDPQQMMMRALALWQTSEDGLALSLLERMTQAYPDDLRPHQLRARILLESCRLGQPEQVPQAIDALHHVLRLSPGDDTSRRLLVDLLAVDDPQAAAQALEEGMMQPDGLTMTAAQVATDLLRLARLYRKALLWRDAQETYRQLVMIQTDDAAIRLEAASLDLDLGAVELAIRRIEQAMGMSGCDESQAMSLLAHAHMRGGRMLAAGRWWWRLHRIDAKHVEAMAGLIVCALALGRHRIVKTWRRKFAIHASREERRHAVTSLWSRSAGGMAVAAQLDGGREATSSVGHGSLLAPLISRAVTALHEHASVHENRADAHYHLAMCQLAAGHKAEATASVDRALQINPRYVAAARLGASLHDAGGSSGSPRLVA